MALQPERRRPESANGLTGPCQSFLISVQICARFSLELLRLLSERAGQDIGRVANK